MIEKYKKKLEEMEKDIKDILKQEEEEKQVRNSFSFSPLMISRFIILTLRSRIVGGLNKMGGDRIFCKI